MSDKKIKFYDMATTCYSCRNRDVLHETEDKVKCKLTGLYEPDHGCDHYVCEHEKVQ